MPRRAATAFTPFRRAYRRGPPGSTVDKGSKPNRAYFLRKILDFVENRLHKIFCWASGQAQSAFAAERISRKNVIIQEAAHLRFQLEDSFAQTSTNPTLAGENTLSAASHQARLPSEYLLSSSVKLFHQMRQVFHDTAAPPSNPMGICVDSKRRKNLMQKRVAIGHKQDAHRQSQSSFG